MNCEIVLELKKFLEYHQMLQFFNTSLRISNDNFAILSSNNCNIIKNVIKRSHFDIYLTPETTQTVGINVRDFLRLLPDSDVIIRIRRNRLEIKSEKN
jgi:hypothetical protein